MEENKKTIIFAVSALALVTLAFLTAPSKSTPDAFLDRGVEFYPDFTDPNSATTLEVIRYDEETGAAIPFKVTFKSGKWTIPSHHDYPADGKDRLAKTAAGVIGIKRDDFRTDNISDHAECGVIDPLDEISGAEGRGSRITLRGSNDQTLADYIVGKEISGRPGFRFVRLPDQKRVYAVRMNLELSARFVDWIDDDPLKISKDELSRITLFDYSVNENTGAVQHRDNLILTKSDATWRADKMSGSQELEQTKLNSMLTALDDLKIVGVRPKSQALANSLAQSAGAKAQVGTAEIFEMQGKGFFFTRNGLLKSNEGELELRSTDGLIFTLQFGEVVYGSGLDVSSGSNIEDSAAQGAGAAENRYFLITTGFDSTVFEAPPKHANTNFQDIHDTLWSEDDKYNKELYDEYIVWESNVDLGQKKANELNRWFAKWYFVIAAESYENIDLSRNDLVVEKMSDSR